MDSQYLGPLGLLISGSRETFAAKNGSVACGLEGDLCFLSAFCTGNGEILSGRFAGVLSLIAACLASLRLVLEALLSVEFLLACREYEFLTAIFAN